MPSESELLDDIFGTKPFWENIYPVSYCDCCEVFTIKCPKCSLNSCGGGGCKECQESFERFGKLNISPLDFALEDERAAYNKVLSFKKFIKICLKNNRPPIDWLWLKKREN